MLEKSSYLLWPAALMLALVITGCGGSGGRDSGNPNARNDTGGQSVDSDSFLGRVNAIIGNNSETAEPGDTESVQETTPETREPALIS